MVFDLTDDKTKVGAVAKAEQLGVKDIYDEHAVKTGFVLLVDASTKQVVAKLTKAETTDQWLAALDSAVQN